MTKRQDMETATRLTAIDGYDEVLTGMAELLESSRRTAARATNAIMTATYWEMGRRIVEFEQGGKERAGYGQALLERLSSDLSTRFGKGFSRQNLQRFREFYLTYSLKQICSTLLSKSGDNENAQKGSTLSSESNSPGVPPEGLKPESAIRILSFAELSQVFPLPWSHYVLLLSRSRSSEARDFYEAEALRGGWTVRQLARQIDSQFYERTALSRNKAAMHLYLNYAREHWTHTDENPPVGLILCAQKDHALARYALEGLPNKVLAAEYRTALPDEKLLAEEVERTRRLLEGRTQARPEKLRRTGAGETE
jgi:hypothetical protein